MSAQELYYYLGGIDVILVLARHPSEISLMQIMFG